MRMPRFRFTVRWLLVAVAILATYSSSAALAQGVVPIPPLDKGLESFTQRSAAKKLLASLNSNTSVDAKVASLIERLVSPDRDQSQAAVTALIMLGPSAIPSIIGRIDDRREMARPAIAFENKSPDAFEGVAQYKVANVFECLDLVLVNLTGESVDFDIIDRRTADPDRNRIVRGWRRYLRRVQATRRVPSKSLPVAVPPRKV